MRRVVSVWCPDWPIARRFGGRRETPPEHPFALVERTTRGLTIYAANRRARSLGVRLGQTHADARALCPGLETEAADPAEDRAGLERLALWCERFSPTVAVDRIGPRLEGLTLDVSGAAHLWGGEALLLADIEGRLAAAGVPCRAALADTVGAAWALARFAPPHRPQRVVSPGGARGALAELPVEGLRLAEPTLVLLKRLGLRRIGDLYPLPRAALARRFQGAARQREAALQVVLRLDQALGATGEALEAVRPAPVYRVWRNFAEPILIVEGVEARLPELMEALAEQLGRDGQGARRLALTAFRVDGRTTGIEVGFSLPAHRPAHLARVLRDAGLERLDLGFGADALMLTAPAAEPVAARQDAMTEGDQPVDAAALPALVDRLQAKLGRAAVARSIPCDRWVPEHSEVLRPADSALSALPALPKPALRKSALSAPSAPSSPQGGRGADDRFRPLLLLEPPEPVEDVLALTPDYPPRRFTWRRVRHQVVRAEGPERIAPEWWRTGLPPPDLDAARPLLKVAREDMEHLERQAAARPQGSRKVSKPGVCVPALPNATGLEGRRPALAVVSSPEIPLIPAKAGTQAFSSAEKAGPSKDHQPQEQKNLGPRFRGDEREKGPLPLTRDYFLVEDEGGERFWLFRDGLQPRETEAPLWWIHGVAA